MSTIITVPAHAFVSAQNRLALRSEHGQTTAEFGVVMLVAVALALAVLALITNNKLDAVLETLLKHVLGVATKMIG